MKFSITAGEARRFCFCKSVSGLAPGLVRCRVMRYRVIEKILPLLYYSSGRGFDF